MKLFFSDITLISISDGELMNGEEEGDGSGKPLRDYAAPTGSSASSDCA